jgi:phosphate transport system permease protein
VFRTLFAVAMTLFLITLTMNIVSQWVLARFREEYE